MTKSTDLTDSIIRIVNDDGETKGTGFVLSNNLAVTCAHVVEFADSGKDKLLNIRFYHGDVPQTVRVHKQGYAPYKSDNEDTSLDDVAFLELEGLPQGVQPVTLGRAKPSLGHKFYSFGFASLKEYEERNIIDETIAGTVRHSRKRPMLELKGDSIKKGLSGAPILDIELEQVVGMISEFGDDTGDGAHPSAPRINWATTVDTLVALWPELNDLVKPDPQTKLLADYRHQIFKDTEFISLQSIPVSYGLDNFFPLERVYIKVQAVDKRDQDKQRRTETDTIVEQAQTKAILNEDGIDFVYIIRMMGEESYRRGEAAEFYTRPDPIDPEQALPDPIDPEQALDEHRHLVILGAPGAGKSTLINYLAHKVAIDPDGPLPIIIRVREYIADERSLGLREFAIKQAGSDDKNLEQAIESQIADGRVLWLIDGLDEAGDKAGDIAIKANHLPMGKEEHQLVITSRSVGYPYNLNRKIFEILPLGIEDTDQFLTDWFSVLAEKRGHPQSWVATQVKDLQNKISDRPRLIPILRNPLLLTFLVILFEQNPYLALPQSRTDLYEQYIRELLLKHWEKSRKKDLSVDLLWDSYLRLGWDLHCLYYSGRLRAKPNEETLSRLLADHLQIEVSIANKLIDFWENAGLLDKLTIKAQKIFTFRHLTFQEYAVAKYLYQKWQHNSGDAWRQIEPHLYHNVWREAFLLLAGLMNEEHLQGFIDRLQKRSKPFSHPQDFFETHKFISAILTVSITLILFPLTLIIIPIYLLLIAIAVVVRLFQGDQPKSQTHFSNRYIKGFYLFVNLITNSVTTWKKEWQELFSSEGNSDEYSIERSIWKTLPRLILSPVAWGLGMILGILPILFSLGIALALARSFIHKIINDYRRSVWSNKKSLNKAVLAATQYEILLATKLIGENPLKVNTTTAKIVARHLAILLESDIPSLARVAAEAAASVSEGDAGKIMLNTLIDDIYKGHPQQSGYVLLQQAEQEQMSSDTVYMLLSKLLSDTNYILLSKIKEIQRDIDIDELKNYKIAQILHLARLLLLTKRQSRIDSVGYYWLIEILSYYPEPPDELVQIVSDEVERSTTEYPKSDYTVHLAQCLVRWEKATSAALTVLASKVYGGTSSKELLDTIATGFSTGQITGDIAEKLIWYIIRWPYGQEEDVEKVFIAVLGENQPYSDVSRIAVLIAIGGLEIKRSWGDTEKGPFPIITTILSQILASERVNCSVFDALAEGFACDDYVVQKTVLDILDKALETKQEGNVPQILQVLLKALDSNEYQIRLSVVTTIKNAIRANIISGELLEDLGPFWRAARDNLENPQPHPYFGYAVGNQYAITDEVASAHLHLTPRDKLLQLPPGDSFDHVSTEIKTAYLSRLRHVDKLEFENEYFDTLRRSRVERQEKAVKKTLEEINAIEKMLKSPDQDQKVKAMQKLGRSINECSIDTSYITLITDELDNDDHHIRRLALNLISSMTHLYGVASSDLARVFYQKLWPIDEVTVDVNEEILDMLASIAKLGYIQEAWLESFITLYDNIRKKAIEDEKLISELPGYESAAKLAGEWFINPEDKYGDKWHEYLNKHPQITSSFENLPFKPEPKMIFSRLQTIARNVENAQSKMRKLTLIVKNAASTGALNAASAQFLLREDIEFFSHEISPIEVYSSIARYGFASPDLIEKLSEFLQNPTSSYARSYLKNIVPEVIYALGQVYSDSPALREQVLAILNQAISRDYYNQVDMVSKIIRKGLIPGRILAPAILESIDIAYRITSAQTQLVGQLSASQYPIPTKYVKKIIDHISQPDVYESLRWGDYLDGLGLIVQQEGCERETFHLIVSILLKGIWRWSTVDEFRQPVAKILEKANIVPQKEVDALFVVLSRQRSDTGQDWLDAAQLIGSTLNAQEEQITHGNQKYGLLSTLHYLLNDPAENICGLKETILQLLGFVDFQANTDFLLDVCRNPFSAGQCRAIWIRKKAIFALTQIGYRHQGRQKDIVNAFHQVFFEEDRSLLTNDDTEFSESLKIEIVEAIGNLQNSSLAARRILLKAIEYPLSRYNSRPNLPTSAVEAFANIKLQPDMSEEITKLLVSLSSSNDRLRDAAWKALNTLEY